MGLVEKLRGLKTYIVAAVILAVAISEGLLGIDIPGCDIAEDWFSYVLIAFGLSTTRAAIDKINNVK